MSPVRNSIEDFVHGKMAYQNSKGVSICWVKGKNFYRVSCNVKIEAGSDGSPLVLYRHFYDGIYAVLLFFDFKRITDIETIDQELLWKLFREGRFFMGCQVDNHPFSLSMLGGKSGTEIEITSRDSGGRQVKYQLPRDVFLKEEDYLNCCSFVLPELLKRKHRWFSVIGVIVKKCLEWITGK